MWVKDPSDPTHAFLIKGDHQKGMNAEMDISQMYRAMGLHQPRIFQFGVADTYTDPQRQGTFKAYPFAVELAGVEFNIDNKGVVGRVFGTPTAAQLKLKNPVEAFQFWLSNMIVANTDRHGSNLMYGTYTDPNDGQEYGSLLVIDNGYGLGGGQGHHSLQDMINNGYGSRHTLKYAAQDWVKNASDNELLNELTTWAQKMRDEAEKREKSMESKKNAQHIINQADEVLNDPDYWLARIRYRLGR